MRQARIQSAEVGMATDFKCDVFLSHNRADKPQVRRLAERLRAADFNIAPCPSDSALHKTVLFRDPANVSCRFVEFQFCQTI